VPACSDRGVWDWVASYRPVFPGRRKTISASSVNQSSPCLPRYIHAKFRFHREIPALFIIINSGLPSSESDCVWSEDDYPAPIAVSANLEVSVSSDRWSTGIASWNPSEDYVWMPGFKFVIPRGQRYCRGSVLHWRGFCCVYNRLNSRSRLIHLKSFKSYAKRGSRLDPSSHRSLV
jgi:hypothetical protein